MMMMSIRAIETLEERVIGIEARLRDTQTLEAKIRDLEAKARDIEAIEMKIWDLEWKAWKMQKNLEWQKSSREDRW